MRGLQTPREQQVVGEAALRRADERRAPACTGSLRYLGRAVVALAADKTVLRKSGTVQAVADLAREVGFTDVDGRQLPAFEL